MTTTTRWILLSGTLLFSLTGPARAQSTADLFLASYDSEAAGKLAEAEAALDRMPAGKKDGFVVALRRGWLLYRQGKHADAIDAYQQAIEKEPRAVESRLGILLPQLALRRFTDAETQARAVLRLDPANYLATLRLAFACYSLHRYDEASALYRKLHDLYPSDVEVDSGLGWSLLKEGKTAEALRIFREGVEVSPRHALLKEGLKAAGG
jgi:tetratricopeptide (TPR) repeat protein